MQFTERYNNKVMFGTVAGLGAVIIWSLAPLLLKLVLNGVDVTQYLFLRFLMSTILFLPVCGGLFSGLRQMSWRHIAFFSGSIAFNFTLQAYALKGLPTSWYIILFSLAPLMTVFILGNKLKLQQLAGFAACIIGTLFFIRLNELPGVGVAPFAFLLLSLVAWIALSKSMVSFQKTFSDVQVSALLNIVGLALFFPLWLLGSDDIALPSTSGLALIGALAVLMPVAFALYSISLRETPQFAMLSQHLEPVLGCLFAFLLLRDQIDTLQWAGIGSIVVGLFWHHRGQAG